MRFHAGAGAMEEPALNHRTPADVPGPPPDIDLSPESCLGHAAFASAAPF